MDRVNVLDKGWIELQEVMGDDLSIVNAARTSYLGESKGDVADKKLLFYLMEHKHTTPFEMVEFKFRVHCPVVTAWHWVRHRTGSFNFSSGRYTEFAEEGFYIPSEWRLQGGASKQTSEGLLDGAACWVLTAQMEKHIEQCMELYTMAVSLGVAREQARLFLPAWASYYTFVWKTDAHNLMHFLKLRMAPEAQYETRVYAQALYEHFFKPTLPWTAEAFMRENQHAR